MNLATDRGVDLDGRHLVLVGLMGSGKSTVGRLVAERLGRRLVDSDECIERRTGQTVRQLRDHHGIDVMRRHEADALFDALATAEPAVVAAAAGVVLDDHDRHRLTTAEAIVVWLDGSPELLAERAVGGAHRPFLDGDAVATLRSMYEDRADRYREVADGVVHVDDLTPEEICDRIVR